MGGKEGKNCPPPLHTHAHAHTHAQLPHSATQAQQTHVILFAKVDLSKGTTANVHVATKGEGAKRCDWSTFRHAAA